MKHYYYIHRINVNIYNPYYTKIKLFCMKRLYFLFALLAISFQIFSQTGTEFWFAPPNVTNDHRPLDQNEVYLNITCLDQDADVHISQPANLGGVDMWVNLTANTSQKVYLGANITDLETKPTNTILNTGLLIESNEKISVYYEYDNYNNPDIFALKGANALGNEFYIPLHNYNPYHNHTYTDKAYASFDIIATEDLTEVRIYPSNEVDGNPAQQQFTVMLNKGQTYSCGWTGANYETPSTHPSGSAVISNKPIAISIKDDSNHGITGCYDLLGDQIVPVDIIGDEYIIVRGQLNAADNEGFFVLATQNGTEVFINGSATPITTLFAGETFRYDISGVGQEYTYVQTSLPVYLTHTTGFGCEIGQAILPPLNCAGSEEVSFVRSTNEAFFLTLLVKSTSTGDFTIIPASAQAVVNSATWTVVPGTGGDWSATTLQFTTGEIPVGTASRLSNSSNIFAMGLINGGGTSGCRYGYFSEFVSEILSDAGNDSTICANTTVTLDGEVSGGAVTGIWSTSGSGTFDDATNFNAEYTPSFADITAGSVILTLSSTGVCFPTSDDMVLTLDPAPTVDAGTDETVCGNNADVSLNGIITVATGGNWTTIGDGSFDNSTNLNAVYTPGITDISNGNVNLFLTTTGNGFCIAEKDSMVISISLAPTINAGVNQSTCSNNAEVTLSATTNGIPTGGQWSGGTGSYNPGSGALNTLYNPSAPEIANGSVTLMVTSTGSGNCIEVSDNIVLTFTASPIISAGVNQIKCANNEETVLNASISGGASTGVWSNGLGTFFTSNTNLGATYTPTATEIANGSVILTLTTTDHNTSGCLAENDQMTISFTPKPTVEAGNNQTVCANNANVSLTGTVTVASGGLWYTTGTGTFVSASSLSTTYIPSSTDKTAGSVKLYLSTTGNASCNEEKDSLIVTITAAPTIAAGLDQTVCANNADITLNGSATIATAWQWSGGAGAYNPGSTAINTIYSPSAAEISSGSIVLTLTSTAQGTCNPVSDNISISFSALPVVNAGIDQIKCANNEITNLSGTVSGGASAGTWTNGLGTFVVDNNHLNASYTPTATEIANGSVTLTLTSSDHIVNGCNAVNDQVTISFTSAPTVDAGADVDVCQNSSDVSLSGNVTIATGGVWSGGVGSYSPSANDINAVYSPSTIEISNASPVTLTLTSSGNGACNIETDQMIINFDPSPIVNAGANQISCENNPQITMQGSVINAGGGMWSGSTGSFSPSNTDLIATFSPSILDIANGGVTLTLTTTGNGNCNPENNTMDLVIVPSPIVNAGANDIYCANNSTINLNGVVTNATGGSWSGGLGIFGDPNSLNTTYQPSLGEINSGSLTLYLTSTGNGSCNSVQDNVTFTFTIAPSVSAGIDQTVCANNSDITLNGFITVASGASWSGGLGTYTPNANNLGAIYSPTAAEISAQSVSLILTTTGNGNCIAVTDIVDIAISASPVVNAGSDIHTCYNNANAILNGNIVNASGGIWSGGSGVYNPSNTTLNADYTPTLAEISSGQIKLYLTSTGNGSCTQVIDSVLIIIDPAPVVNAGTNITVCANNSNAVLNGSVSLASGGVWSGGLGLFTPNNSMLNATYTPTAGDIANGSVTLTLTSTGNGTCNAVDDVVTIFYSPSPTVDAGVDFDVCANNNQIDLNGIITVASGGAWSGGTGTYNPNSNTLITSYYPTATEIATGVITLSLTSTGNGNCNSVIDDIEVIINASPFVNAGIDKNVCVDNLTASLNGSVSGITNTGIWSTSGSGFFVPNNTTLNADYVCSAADSLAGSVTITLTSTNNNVCLSESDDMIIQILPAGIANAGSNQTVCANNSVISLNGSVSGGAATGIWSTSGNGIFVPADTVLNAVYIPSTLDTTNGTVDLTLTANSCNMAQNTITITITPAPSVNAGLDQTVCVDNLDIQLDGTITGASSTGIWYTVGTGTFDPTNTTIDAMYHASTLDSINQHLTLILESTNIGNCNIVRDTMLIDILPAGVVNAGQDQTLCSNNSIIQLNGSVSGGASQAQWTSSGSGTFLPSIDSLNATYTPTAADISAGSVSLALSSTNSCNFALDVLTVYFTAAPTSNAGIDASLCGNNADLSLNGSFTIATGAIWSTSGTGGFSPSTANMIVVYSPSVADISNGGVDIYLSTTGNGGCNAVMDTMQFTITQAPNVNAGVNQVVCSTASSTQLTGSVTGSTTTGLWTTTGAGTLLPTASDLNASYQIHSSDVTAGSIQLTLESTNNGNCLIETDVMTITFGNSTFAYAGVDQDICADNLTVSLSGIASGGTTTGTWTSSGNGVFTPNVDDLNANYYCSALDSANGFVELFLTTTNNGGCSAGVDTMVINISSVPLISAGADIEVCKGIDSVALAGNYQYTQSIQWTSNGSGVFVPNDTSLNIFYLPSSADTLNGFVNIYLESTGNAVCNEVVDTMLITFSVPVAMDFSSNLACVNKTVNFTDISTVISGSITDWYWDYGDGSVGSGQSSIHSYSSVGNFFITLTVESSLGCSYSRTEQITVYPTPVTDFTFSSECYLDGVGFVDASTINTGTVTVWYWTFGNGDTSVVQNPTNIFSNAGTYTVELLSTSSQGCKSSYSQQVDVYPAPTVDFTYIYDCANSNVNFTDASSAQGGNPLNSWAWTFGDGNTSTVQNPQNFYANQGLQTVNLISGSSFNCSDTITKSIFLNTINADFNFVSTCVYDSINFIDMSDLNGDTAISYLWTLDDGNFNSSTNPSHKYILSGNYSVILEIQSTNGCVDTVVKSIEIYPKPIAGFDFFAEDYVEGYTIDFTDLSTGAESWQWSFGDGVTSTVQNSNHIYNAPNEYTIVQSITNIYNCVDSASTIITILPADDIYFPVLPTAFTPNGDKVNDILYVRGGPFVELTFRIYNEWGEVVFESNEESIGWDGTRNGVLQPIGVYVYTVKALTSLGKDYVTSGEITLIR